MKSVLAYSLKAIVSLALFICSDLARAQPRTSSPDLEPVQSVHLKPLIEFLQKSIVVVRKPLTVYSWFQGADKSLWTKKLLSSSPAGFQSVQESSNSFWQQFGQNLNENLYGRGLYTAVDPVVTRSFGGDQWVLLQIQVPEGFRAMNLLDKRNANLPLSLSPLLREMGCSSIPNLPSLFKPLAENPACLQALTAILRDHLQIDGFFYEYGSAFFHECEGQEIDTRSVESQLRHSALVITSSKLLKPSHVKVFNTFTEDALEDRVRIQSLFYKTDTDSTSGKNSSAESILLYEYANQVLQAEYPGYFVQKTKGHCQNDRCSYTAEICDMSPGATRCTEVPMPVPPPRKYPGRISQQYLPLGDDRTNRKLLWSDLERHPTDAGLGNWVRQNLVGCSSGQIGPNDNTRTFSK